MLYIKKYRDIVYRIIGASIEVFDTLQNGLLEAVYQEALSIELTERGITNQREQEIEVFYKGHKLDKKYKMDIVVDDIIIELKSTKEIIPAHRAQLCNYLRLTRKPIGLLINFGESSLHGERWALDMNSNECYLVDKHMEIVIPEVDPLDDSSLFDSE